MRCKNCGWDNPNGLTKCEKCNMPLEGGVSNKSAASYGGTAIENNNAAPAFSKTVREESVFGNDIASAFAPKPSNDGRCPECGYPLRPGVSVCPKCHHIIGRNDGGAESGGVNYVGPAATLPENAMPSNSEKKRTETTPFDGTVMPGLNMSPDIWFTLAPIAHQGEREIPHKVEFEDKHVELNRENLDPKNHTITSKVQAVMDYDSQKKKWYIQDKSAQHYTFVRCAGEMPLMDGDEVLMGDRRFVFHAETFQVAPKQIDYTGTIAVGRQRVNVPKCTLTPIVDEGEQDAPATQIFRGDVHQLNRANLDPENHTITSRVQAVLFFKDGSWFIKDDSSLKTTYIYCADPIDLKDGDMILMGNRTFIFNC